MHACKRWRWVPTLVAAVTAMLKGACWLKSMCVTGPNCKKRMLLSLATMTPMMTRSCLLCNHWCLESPPIASLDGLSKAARGELPDLEALVLGGLELHLRRL